MNLLEYLETLSLNEANQPTLKNLIDNYRKVFPYSDKDIQVVNWHIDGKDKQDTVIKGLVKSQSGNGSVFFETIIFLISPASIILSSSSVFIPNSSFDLSSRVS